MTVQRFFHFHRDIERIYNEIIALHRTSWPFSDSIIKEHLNFNVMLFN
jgi:hypothetical protein